MIVMIKLVKKRVEIYQEHGVDLTGIIVIIAAILLVIAKQKKKPFGVKPQSGQNALSKKIQ